MSCLGTIPPRYIHMKFWVPRALWWGTMASQSFPRFLLSEFCPPSPASVYAVGATILGGHHNHPRPPPTQWAKGLICPCLWAKGPKNLILWAILDPILRQLLT